MDAAYFSRESVRAATISARPAPIAPATAAAVPPPGVGAEEARTERNCRIESSAKSVTGSFPV